MVHFRQVQKGITLEALDKIASEYDITVARTEDSNSESLIPAFPALLISAQLKYPTRDVESNEFVGTGPILGLHVIMRANSERVFICSSLTNHPTVLAYNMAKKLRKAGDKIEPSMVQGAFSGEYGLDELAADGKQPI